MEIKEHTESGITILSVEGELDYHGAGEFQKQALVRVNAGTRCLLIDFGGTNFIASMGIRAIMVPYQEISKAGGKLAITGLNPQLEKLFETAGLRKLFTVYASIDEALADESWPRRPAPETD